MKNKSDGAETSPSYFGNDVIREGVIRSGGEGSHYYMVTDGLRPIEKEMNFPGKREKERKKKREAIVRVSLTIGSVKEKHRQGTPAAANNKQSNKPFHSG
jgi:hypothetical protein